VRVVKFVWCSLLPGGCTLSDIPTGPINHTISVSPEKDKREGVTHPEVPTCRQGVTVVLTENILQAWTNNRGEEVE
jgi:hypothetical protein